LYRVFHRTWNLMWAQADQWRDAATVSESQLVAISSYVCGT
jgi:hypothetical protein